jgi:hypothetical protein
MLISRPCIRATLLVGSLAIAAIALGCSEAARSASDAAATTGPHQPVVPPKPTIVLSTDSVVASAVNGADVLTYDVSVTPGDTTKLHSLAVVTGGFSDGDPGAWLSAQIDTAGGPAKISIRVDPARAGVGVHVGAVTVTAQFADSKSIRVRLDVRPRPILLADSTTRALTAQLGDSIPPTTVALRSSSDIISKLSLAAPECGGRTWLSARLSGESTPAVVTLSVDARGLAAGAFECRVQVQSSQTLVDSASRTIVVSLTLRQTPRIALDLATTQNIGANAGADAGPIRLQITNAGTGTLDGLSIGPIDYEGASGWLTATLDRTVAPATLTLAATARSLGGGTFKATIPIRSTADGVANSPMLVTVNFVVAPKTFRFVISPTAVALTYNITTGVASNPVSVSFFDANASGQKATITRSSLSITSASGTCSPFAYSIPGPAGAPLVLPQAWIFFLSVGAVYTPGNCSYLYSVTLDNGQSASFSITVSVTP